MCTLRVGRSITQDTHVCQSPLRLHVMRERIRNCELGVRQLRRLTLEPTSHALERVGRGDPRGKSCPSNTALGGDQVNASEMGVTFQAFPKQVLFGLTSPVCIAIAVSIAFWLFLNMTRAGRGLYAVGGNPVSARDGGIDKPKQELMANPIPGYYGNSVSFHLLLLSLRKSSGIIQS